MHLSFSRLPYKACVHPLLKHNPFYLSLNHFSQIFWNIILKKKKEKYFLDMTASRQKFAKICKSLPEYSTVQRFPRFSRPGIKTPRLSVQVSSQNWRFQDRAVSDSRSESKKLERGITGTLFKWQCHDISLNKAPRSKPRPRGFTRFPKS